MCREMRLLREEVAGDGNAGRAHRATLATFGYKPMVDDGQSSRLQPLAAREAYAANPNAGNASLRLALPQHPRFAAGADAARFPSARGGENGETAPPEAFHAGAILGAEAVSGTNDDSRAQASAVR